jgi:pyruvate/2-oxoglutarate dehydrogenase complex dihydrolipoamide dehydrogenase (E3) component
MAVDYDLVVIGATPEGRFAALKAAYLKARVALVEQPLQTHLEGTAGIFHRTFTHTTRLYQQWQDRGFLMAGAGTRGRGDAESDLSKLQFGEYTRAFQIEVESVKAWAQEVDKILTEQDSLSVLAALGVDVVEGSGEFCRLPHLAFVVGNRKLRSRTYLMATGSQVAIPAIEGLSQVGCLSARDFWQSASLNDLDAIAIVGGSPAGIQLAQNLRHLGKRVTLIVENSFLLPQEDLEVIKLVQAQLEADGVEILWQSPVTQVKQIEGKKWLQAGNRAIEVDEIAIATPPVPNVAGLNLEGAGVQINSTGILLNARLQTTNPRIYACGSVAGGYALSHLAQYEANLALKNALFLPIFKADYRYIPWVLLTHPQLARVGMTEAQARRRCGKEVRVVQRYFKTVAQAQVLGETTGFCKLVVRDNGTILGAHLVGAEAAELIGAIALAMKHNIKVGELANFLTPSLTLSEILQQTALEWHYQQLQDNKSLQNFLESLFIWRRNWAS